MYRVPVLFKSVIVCDKMQKICTLYMYYIVGVGPRNLPQTSGVCPSHVLICEGVTPWPGCMKKGRL